MRGSDGARAAHGWLERELAALTGSWIGDSVIYDPAGRTDPRYKLRITGTLRLAASQRVLEGLTPTIGEQPLLLPRADSTPGRSYSRGHLTRRRRDVGQIRVPQFPQLAESSAFQVAARWAAVHGFPDE